MRRVGRDDQKFGSARLKAAGSAPKYPCRFVPFAFVLKLLNLLEVNRMHKYARGTQSANAPPHLFIYKLVVQRR
jgi:hypothetical protein